ncbi:MAG: TauD/TfdA family dioxygenase [Pseudomonadota bacterium]|nr:TauD/TfdA family dioxygenase [Pseudomonadota bacterium]
MAVEVIPFSETMAAQICGVDLARPLGAAESKILLDAWHQHVVLVFRDQIMDDLQLKGSASWLGETSKISMPRERRGDEDTEIQKVSNILDDSGMPIGALGDGEMWFHHDNSFTEAPDKATWLYAVELPSAGGNTLFGNCYEAYEALPDKLKKLVSGRRVLQVYDYTVRTKPRLTGLDETPHFWQPAVVRHPATGRKALYVDRLMTAAIDGCTQIESDQLLAELFPYIERVDYEHEWQLGDYVVWDNRCSVHARREFPVNQRRLLKRGKVEGNSLIGAG